MTVSLTKQRGAVAIIMLMAVSVVALTIMTTMSVLATSELELAADTVQSDATFYAAEAGINDGLMRLVYHPVPQSYPLKVGAVNVAVDITVHPIDPFKRLLTARAEDATGKVRTLTVTAQTNARAKEISYAVHTGRGGLQMEENSSVVGPVYANGNISGGNNSLISGDVWVAGGTNLTPGPKQMERPTTFAVANTAPWIDVAQQFVAPSDEPLRQVKIAIRRTGVLPDNTYQLRVVEDNGSGSPSTSILAEKSIQKNDFPQMFNWPDGFLIDFGTGPILTANQKYWLVLNVTSTNATNYFEWGRDLNDAAYPDGVAKYSADMDTGPWLPVGGDLAFETSFGIGDTYLDNVDVNGDLRAYEVRNTTVSGQVYCQIISNSTPATCNTEPAPPRVDFPIDDADINDWIVDAESGGTHPGDLTVSDAQLLGPKKIDGNLYLTGNDAHLTVTGNLYVTGAIVAQNPGGVIELAESLGPESKVIIADGRIDLKNNTTVNGSGNAKSYALMISRHPSIFVDNPAVYSANNADAVLFYAARGMIKLKNGSALNGTTGYIVYLENISTVTYDPNLKNFTVTPDDDDDIVTIDDTWEEK